LDQKTLLTLSVTVLLALLGYVATYLYNLRLSQRKDRLGRINRQLQDLYGPLYSLVRTSSITWDGFRQKCRPGGAFWDPNNPPSADEAAEWRLWMTTVFMPLNLRMEKTIIEHTDLLDETNMPLCLLMLCAHVSSYKSVIGRLRVVS